MLICPMSGCPPPEFPGDPKDDPGRREEDPFCWICWTSLVEREPEKHCPCQD
jgi:hypothetical protein